MAKDYFSTQSGLYQQYRPRYPAALFDFLLRDYQAGSTAWDCATGNGQAALALARAGATVVASDHSAAQLAHAEAAAGVHYVRAAAEGAPLADHSVALVTVAQALHWFEFDRFYAEVRRVLVPGGRLAVWTYSFLSVTPQLGAAIDAAIRRFYHDVVGPYWPPERRWVDAHYRTIPFPFDEIETPAFTIEVAWDLAGVLGYIASWSAVQQYRRARNNDPMAALASELAGLWLDPHRTQALHWPLGLRVGSVQ